MSKKKLGGYAVRQELTRARNANQAARVALERMMDAPQMGQGSMYLLISKTALALTTILEAVDAIERIAREDEKFSEEG